MVDVVHRDVPVKMVAKIAEVLSPIAPEVASRPGWTAQFAAALIAGVPGRARNLIHLLIVHSGFVNASQVRADGEETLRGLTRPVTTAQTRPAQADKLPDGLPNPVETRYDLDMRAYQKAIAFEMPRETRLTFGEGWNQFTRGTGR